MGKIKINEINKIKTHTPGTPSINCCKYIAHFAEQPVIQIPDCCTLSTNDHAVKDIVSCCPEK